MLLLETFRTLLTDPGHYEFELFLILVFDFLLGALVWPHIKAHIHKDDQHLLNVELRLNAGLARRIEALEAAVWPGEVIDNGY